MMVECGVYGLVCGLMMLRVHTGKLYADLYISQITAMLLGRVLSGVCKGASVRAGDVLDRRVGNGIVCNGSAGHHHPARAAALARGGADEGAAAARPVRIR